MDILITGGTGFVGRHAIAELQRHGHTVSLLTLPGFPIPTGIPAYEADIRDQARLAEVLRQAAPDACLHLAGIAFVPHGWEKPVETFEVNLNGTVHLLDALREVSPHTRLLAVTSALLYGAHPRPGPIQEEDQPLPDSVYAVSKLAADLTVLLYARRYGQPVMTARPCNHIGPGQSLSFVVPSFARQLLAIRSGKSKPVMKVGNLASTREFLDVRDVVSAYRLLLESGEPGEAYNISAAKSMTIQSLLDELCRLTGVHPTIEIDPERFRPTDHQPVLASDKCRKQVGWEPRLTITETLQAVIVEMGQAERA